MKIKQKTHKASAKRFKVTRSGILLHNRQKDNSHMKTKKNRKQKSRLRGQDSLKNITEIKKIKSLI